MFSRSLSLLYRSHALNIAVARPALLLPNTAALLKKFSSYSEDFPAERTRFRGESNYNSQRNDRFDNTRFGGGAGGGYKSFDNKNSRFGGGGGYGRQTNNQLSSSQLVTPDWSRETLVEFKKDFYEPHPNSLNRSKEEIQQYYQQHEITVKGDAPSPIQGFDELQVPDQILNELKKKNFENVTPIQAQGWPIALSGKNLVAIAQTG